MGWWLLSTYSLLFRKVHSVPSNHQRYSAQKYTPLCLFAIGIRGYNRFFTRQALVANIQPTGVYLSQLRQVIIRRKTWSLLMNRCCATIQKVVRSFEERLLKCTTVPGMSSQCYNEICGFRPLEWLKTACFWIEDVTQLLQNSQGRCYVIVTILTYY